MHKCEGENNRHHVICYSCGLYYYINLRFTYILTQYHNECSCQQERLGAALFR